MNFFARLGRARLNRRLVQRQLLPGVLLVLLVVCPRMINVLTLVLNEALLLALLQSVAAGFPVTFPHHHEAPPPPPPPPHRVFSAVSETLYRAAARNTILLYRYMATSGK